MRVGLLGGTFNPVHLAHLRTAEEVREHCTLDRIDFVLSAVPPHKDARDLAPVEARRAMLALALAGNPVFALNTLELERVGRSYSVDTVRAAQTREPDAELTFILGADAFAEIASWKDFEALFALCNVCVISRPGAHADHPPIAVENAFCYDPTRGVYRHRSGNSLSFLPVTPLMISASDIRARRQDGRSICYLVPPPVHEYILAHDLYRGRPAAR